MRKRNDHPQDLSVEPNEQITISHRSFDRLGRRGQLQLGRLRNVSGTNLRIGRVHSR